MTKGMLDEIETMLQDNPEMEIEADKADLLALAHLDDVAQSITFENCHIVAHILSNEKPKAARALLEELQMWAKTGLI